MKTLLVIGALLVSVSFVSAESNNKTGALRAGDSITVYDMGNGIKSYWDQHGNNMQTFDRGGGMQIYSTGKSHGQIYEPFAQPAPRRDPMYDPLELPPSNNYRLKRCGPEEFPKVYC